MNTLLWIALWIAMFAICYKQVEIFKLKRQHREEMFQKGLYYLNIIRQMRFPTQRENDSPKQD